ncbi:divalent-cation tolerance protein CutA [Aurantiacibacter sp. D1-12]|uniref:divalent-cation tolerance protein CutA n=1 Tax=Aurantiacibacter sp. D1-12 TaxID=2993658 RepID=UPI00237C8783|nr:divalent-cation tolerance protein CutA [Aurantiacibacter sp. D1-12]MDE1468099.1 divalent-cation tolerance protein CutA [Aurantiacibacter sp. D1-12]
MSEAGAALIWCPFGDEASAREVAETLLSERLIACANILPHVMAVFHWEGAVQSGQEVGVLFKTTHACLEKAVARLEQLHTYDTPAIMGWPVDAAPPATLGWLADQIRGGE